MAKEPVTIQTYALNTEALQAQQYLKAKGVESFIFMESSWTGRGQDSHQRIRLVARPADAERAMALLEERTRGTGGIAGTGFVIAGSRALF